ncbi:hypothetical protein ACHQM5_007172 [Ranunculus cassubicifolius]
MHRRRDWTSLPVEILQLISENLHTNFIDLYLFRSICKSFGQIQLQKPQIPPPQLPWLLLPSLHNNRPRFYSISDNKIYHLPPSDSFNQSSCCRRSSLGWLLIIDDNTLDCSLFNPLTRVRVSLPSMSTVWALIGVLEVGERKVDRDKLIGKVVLSGNPDLDHKEEISIVVLVYGYLIYAKLGDKAWKHLEDIRDTIYGFDDVVYFNEKFYAVDSWGLVVICDLGSSSPGMKELTTSVPASFQSDKENLVVPLMTYLVESSGELLLIRRFRGQKLRRTIVFKVFKDDPISKSWVEVESLDGHALFLGYNHSLSLLASNYFRCKANCIYFTDNIFNGTSIEKLEPHDVGIFNVETGIIELLPGYWCDHQFLAQPPILLTPSPW